MAINPSNVAAQQITDVTDFAIEISYSRITHGQDAPLDAIPYTLIGYFNPATNRVELYCVNGSGNTYLKVL